MLVDRLDAEGEFLGDRLEVRADVDPVPSVGEGLIAFAFTL